MLIVSSGSRQKTKVSSLDILIKEVELYFNLGPVLPKSKLNKLKQQFLKIVKNSKDLPAFLND